jgi:hypothetical protein
MSLRLTPPLLALVATASCADLLGFKPGMLVGTGGSSVASASSSSPDDGGSAGTAGAESAGTGVGGRKAADRGGSSAGAAGAAGNAGRAGGGEVAGAAGIAENAGSAGTAAGAAGSAGAETGGSPTGGRPITGGRPVTGGKPATGGRPTYGGRAATGGKPATGGSAPCEGDQCGTGGSGGMAQLNLPAYVDNKVCAQILSDPEGSTTAECVRCCSGYGFSESSFIYYDRCTCGNLPASDPGPCGAVVSSLDFCSGCCQDNGYTRATLGGSCVCSYWSDTVTCADTVGLPDAGRACANCCLEHGNLAFSYAAIPFFACSCTVK